MALAEGKYTGDLHASVTAVGGTQQANMTLTLNLEGTITLTADAGGSIDEGKIQLDYHFGGSGAPVPTVVGGMDFKATSTLDIKRGNGKTFRATGKLSGGGKIFAYTDTGVGASPGGGASDALEIKFEIEQSTCEFATGSFTSPLLTGTVAALQAKGFQVTSKAGTWHIGTSSELSKKIAKLVKDLDKSSPGGMSPSHEAEVERLGKIGDDVRKNQNPLERDCLFKVWYAKVHSTLAGWLAEDMTKLAAYQGDYAGMTPLIRKVLEDGKALTLVGTDGCSERLLEQLWDLIGTKLSALLDQLIKTNAPPVDILSVMKSTAMIGALSPRLEQRAIDAILKQIFQIVKASEKALNAATKTKPCGPSVQAEWLKFQTALHQASLMGVPTSDYAYVQAEVQACYP